MKKKPSLRSLLLLLPSVLLNACGLDNLAQPTQATPTQTHPTQLAFVISPLPGGLDQRLVLHSNNPERIETAGILISTRAQAGDAFLSQPLSGDFDLFLHHIARTPILSGEQIYLGLVASLPDTQTSGSVELKLLRGNAFLTRPDAPFIELPAVQANSAELIFSGPGDRLALAELTQASTIKPQRWQISKPVLLNSWQLPTNPLWAIQQDNALSGLLHFRSQADIDLSLIAIKASSPPALADYLALLKQAQRAGPADANATVYDPQEPPGGGTFRYGRVAGLVQGSQWQGQIEVSPTQISQLESATALAWPVASLYLKRYGTGQSQSAPVIKRLPGAAIESQGNYGLHYRLEIKLPAREQARRYRLSLTQPQSVNQGQPVFLNPPATQISFRGSIQVSEAGLTPPAVTRTHLVLHAGERPAPFWQADIAAAETRSLLIEWVYPADATPPQLLLLESEPI